eukprot:4389177-Prymnesium_polylepis.1
MATRGVSCDDSRRRQFRPVPIPSAPAATSAIDRSVVPIASSCAYSVISSRQPSTTDPTGAPLP